MENKSLIFIINRIKTADNSPLQVLRVDLRATCIVLAISRCKHIVKIRRKVTFRCIASKRIFVRRISLHFTQLDNHRVLPVRNIYVNSCLYFLGSRYNNFQSFNNSFNLFVCKLSTVRMQMNYSIWKPFSLSSWPHAKFIYLFLVIIYDICGRSISLSLKN